jgi:hypothetical protein
MELEQWLIVSFSAATAKVVYNCIYIQIVYIWVLEMHSAETSHASDKFFCELHVHIESPPPPRKTGGPCTLLCCNQKDT